jgi:hypothetical protein
MYRVLHRLNVGKGRILHPGSFNRLEWLNERGVERLTAKGAISRVNPPPLAVLPGWSRRAEKITEVAGGEITNAEQFLEADDEKLAEWMKVKPAVIKRWKGEIMKWLTTDPARPG